MDRQINIPAQADSTRAEPHQSADAPAAAGGVSVEQVFHRLSAPLRRYAIGLGFSPEEAEEAVQEGFLRLQAAFLRHEPVHNPDAFLHTVVRHLLIDSARLRNRFDACAGQLVHHARQHSGAPAKMSADLCRLAEALLSPRETEVFNMRRDGRSYAEISTELGISRGTVGALVSRAVAKIRRHAKRPA
jgi:RNA polymerase sigma-70 factor (ECF subfamily)